MVFFRAFLHWYYGVFQSFLALVLWVFFEVVLWCFSEVSLSGTMVFFRAFLHWYSGVFQSFLGNMGNCHLEKTNVDQGEVEVDIGFRGVTISHVTLLCIL